ncbi:S-4TM family putative pore-forming effector [Streptomyces sp. ECR3.8]|uniref:S-4TM family putative pore-forming effector n=1 Tax=Streptomyces sp. ECR3.8 TaxID=3461009 RepID=UPI004041CED7
MVGRTTPSIAEAQNQDRSIRLLAAQRRMYSDIKALNNLRLAVVVVGGVSGAVCALVFANARSVIGAVSGVTLLCLSLAGASSEKAKTKKAAAVQEEFDTTVFKLPWNNENSQRVSPSEVARASLRHRGDGLNDWYADTDDAPRPLDILMCQRSNLGWGISMHRAWASSALWACIAILVISAVPCLVMSLTFSAALFGVYVPLIAVVKELVEIWRSNLESALRKDVTEGRASHLLANFLEDGALPSESDCRQLQNEIWESRQTNAIIPDWFYKVRRSRDEEAMRLSVDDFISQARERGAW